MTCKHRSIPVRTSRYSGEPSGWNTPGGIDGHIISKVFAPTSGAMQIGRDGTSFGDTVMAG